MSLVIAAVMGGALLLWVGFALLVAALLLVAIPFSIWSIFARRRSAKASVTIEGSARRVDARVLLPEERPEAGSRDSQMR